MCLYVSFLGGVGEFTVGLFGVCETARLSCDFCRNALIKETESVCVCVAFI